MHRARIVAPLFVILSIFGDTMVAADVTFDQELNICISAQASTFDSFAGSLSCNDTDDDTFFQILLEDPAATAMASCEDPAIGTADSTVTGSLTFTEEGAAKTVVASVSSNGSAVANAETLNAETSRGNPNANSFADVCIFFEIEDEPTPVSISISESLNGDSSFFAVLEHNGEFIGELCPTCDPPVSTMPTSVSEIGNYGLSADIDGGSFQGPGESEGSIPTYSFSLTVTISTGGAEGTEVHWVNSQGGAYEDATNWDPQQVPLHNAEQSDVAFFDFETEDPVAVSAADATAGRWVIRGMEIDLDGAAQVFSALGPDASLTVGNGGVLSLNSLATFNSIDAVIGDVGDGVVSSEVNVSGLGTEWSNVGNLTIGGTSPAIVSVADQGLLEGSLELRIGQGAVGELSLDSEADVNTGNLQVGFEDAAGILNVAGGSKLTSDQASVGFGTAAGSIATVRGASASGDASEWECTGSLDVGGEAGGTLELFDGAFVIVDSLTISSDEGDTGAVSLFDDDDPDLITTFQALDAIEVGLGGTASLSVFSGSKVVADELVDIGGEAAVTVTIRGTSDNIFGGEVLPSRLISEAALIVAGSGDTTLAIEDGGRVDAREMSVGDSGELSGVIDVRGGLDLASTLDASDVLKLGDGGFTELLIGDGGLVVGDNILLGSAEGGITVATVEGRQSQNGRRSTLLTEGENSTGQASLVVGNLEEADLEITDAASLLTDDASIGENAAGKVTITNTTDVAILPFDDTTGEGGSFWIANDLIVIGGSSMGELAVTEHAVVSTPAMVLGVEQSGSGFVTLESTIVEQSARLNVEDFVIVGDGGFGSLTIHPGGEVISGDALVGNAEGEAFIDADGIGQGQWIVNGDLGIAIDPLDLTLTETDSSRGSVTIANGALVVTGEINLGVDGEFIGVGTVEATSVLNSGTISPGINLETGPFRARGEGRSLALQPVEAEPAIGVLTVDGDYEQPEAGVLSIEIAGTDEGQFDVLHVTGDAVLEGTVDLIFVDGFVPNEGDAFDFVIVDGTITGILTGEAVVEADDSGGRDDDPDPPVVNVNVADNTAEPPGNENESDNGNVAEPIINDNQAEEPPAALVYVVWEVTPEGTCRVTVTEVEIVDTSNGGIATSAYACGAGSCGAGLIAGIPLVVGFLIRSKSSLRRPSSRAKPRKF